jgi:hypothetical protein
VNASDNRTPNTENDSRNNNIDFHHHTEGNRYEFPAKMMGDVGKKSVVKGNLKVEPLLIEAVGYS